jgi:hypothetical protein
MILAGVTHVKHAIVVALGLSLGACAWAPGVPNMCEVARVPGSLSCQNGDKNFEAVAAPAAAAPAPEPPKEVAPEPPKEAPAPTPDPPKEPEKPAEPPKGDKPGHGHGDKNHDHDHRGDKPK